MQCLLGVGELPSNKEIEVFVRAAVKRFLGGCRLG
jgi:hypothetical protein